MSDSPRISVIVPTFNRKALISRSIESVLAQSMEEFELVVVDDASIDGTEHYVKERYADPRIRYERLQINGGVHAARNKGMEIARGTYVLFLDSDDELYPDTLERICSVFEAHNASLVLAPYRMFTGGLTGFEKVSGEMHLADLLCGTGARQQKTCLTAVRRTVIGDIRWEGKNLDFIFAWRIASRAKTFYLAEACGIYHVEANAASMTSLRKIPNVELSIHRSKAIARALRDFGPIILKNCAPRYGYYAYGAAVGHILSGDIEEGRALAHEALLRQPRARYRALYVLSLIPGSAHILRSLFSTKKYAQKIFSYVRR